MKLREIRDKIEEMSDDVFDHQIKMQMHTLAEEIDKRLAGSKPDKNDVEKKVFEVICQQLGYVESELKLETNVKLEIGADSLDIIELSIALEEEFGTEIEDSELEKWDTVSAFVEGVYELVVNK